MIDESIGYPVAIKAAGGGGGKGFRVAESEDELEKAFEGAAREGEKFFSDPTVYIERYLPDPRHVEVQILADGDGQRDPPVRARLLGAAPPPEADRGEPGAGGRPRAARADRQDRHRRRARGRLPLGRHDRGAARRRRVLLPRDEHARAGRALRDRDGHGHRHRARAGQDRRRRAARLRAGGRGAARPRDRVPHQRRGRLQELRARARPDRVLPRAGGAVRARGLGRRGGLRGAAAVRPDDRQADRLGRRPRGVDAADAARARRVRDRRAEDADPVPPGAARDRAVAQRRDLPRPGRGQGLAQAAGLPAPAARRRRGGRGDGRARVRRRGVGPQVRREGDRRSARGQRRGPGRRCEEGAAPRAQVGRRRGRRPRCSSSRRSRARCSRSPSSRARRSRRAR